MSVKSKFVLPFSVKFDSEVTGGYADNLHSAYKSNTEIVNYHKDQVELESGYGTGITQIQAAEVELQSPFTERWVGGRSYRHVNLNTGFDNAENRREGWHVDFQPNVIRLYSHSFLNSPPAYWTRDGRTKKPVNIANIQNEESYLGNYRENYEFLQTSGRRITNNLIVDGFIATGDLTTQFIREVREQEILLSEDFSSYPIDSIIDTNSLVATPYNSINNATVRERQVGVPGKKYVVLNSSLYSTFPNKPDRTLALKESFSGKNIFKVSAIKSNTIGNFDKYDPSGLNLQGPNLGEDLVLQYSFDNVNWTTHETILQGSDIAGTGATEVTSEIILEFSSPYYVRYFQIDHSGQGNDNYGLTDLSVVESLEIQDFRKYSYLLPDLNEEGGSRSVIVERFNAPGSKEESSRGALDREGEEMSPNIPLPFRNIKIRQPFYRQLAQHNPQFGSGSTYALLPGTGIVDAVTVHKINRNRLPGNDSINDFFDNGYVTHAIPRTDIQYSWITASSITTSAELRGYQSFRTSTYNRNMAFDDIGFISGSLVVSGSSQQFFVDNLFINSLAKEQKNIDITTNTITIPSSLSVSFAEYANTPYTFTSWSSMRLGDTPVPRKLRKDNTISILDSISVSEQKEGESISVDILDLLRRGWTTTNYKETPVTFKYLPLEHDLRFSRDGDLYQIEHEFANTLSLFANKELTEKLNLERLESTKRFYDYLFKNYRDLSNLLYEGHNYKEIIWPREENTGLSRTRKRTAYYLDKPGIDRDGYDRQLGTQRAFWRDSQSDRKRSNLSDGGYYSSMNYLSTDEIGSDLTKTKSSVYTDDQLYTTLFSFKSDPGINYGLYNSFSMLESAGQERQNGTTISQVGLIKTIGGIQYNNMYYIANKRFHSFESMGEFNSGFRDFYEMFRLNGDSEWSSIGSLYRNTDYKSVICQPIQEVSLYNDFISETEDDKIRINPKLKYISFPGGVEVNTGTYVQNKQNFDSSYFQTTGVEGIVYSQIISGSDLYIGGSFNTAAGLGTQSRSIVKYNLDTQAWIPIGPAFPYYVRDMVLSGSDLYVAGNFTSIGGESTYNIGKYDTITQTWSSLDGGIGTDQTTDQVEVLVLSGSDLYVGGKFSVADWGGQDISVENLAKWDTIVGAWSEVGGGVRYSNNNFVTVKAIAFSGSDMYVGGKFSTVGTSNVPAAHIAKYNLNSQTWSSLDGGLADTGRQVESLIVSGSDLYVGGTFYRVNSTPTPIYDSAHFVRWDTVTSTWNRIGALDYVYSLALVENDIYLGGKFGLSKYNTKTQTMTNGLSEADPIYHIHPDYDNRLYIGGGFQNIEETFPKCSFIFVYNISENRPENLHKTTFSFDYYSQEFPIDDFSFSTMDNGLKRTTEEISGKKPFFDSYEEFVSDVVGKTKDYSIVPEFRIGDHIEYYIQDQNENFSAINRAFLYLDGGSETDFQSANSRDGNYNDSFFTTFATSDLLKKYEKIKNDNDGNSELESITINVKGIKKLLPYNGFYPQDRTVQIANLYNQYMDKNLAGGTYNVSYRTDYFSDPVISGLGGNIVSIGCQLYGGEYYLAVSYYDGGTGNNKISIFKTRNYNIEDFDPNEIHHFTPLHDIYDSRASWDSQESQFLFRYNFADRLQFIAASNGLNIITNSSYLDSSDQTGGLLIASSSDGETWSDLQKLEIYGSSPPAYISGSNYSGQKLFGKFYKALYDNNSSQEKILIAITDFTHDSTTPSINMNGGVWVVTGTLENNEWRWSEKKEIHVGDSFGDKVGVGVDIISCSAGYQIFFGEAFGDYTTSNAGNIWAVTSSDGETWSSPVVIAAGSQDGSMAINGIKAVDFDNKTYVFYADPYEDVGTYNNNGGAFCITSSINNQWPSSNTKLDKKVVYYRPEVNDYALDDKISYSIEAFSGSSDGKLHYFFASAGGGGSDHEVAYGNKKGENWRTSEEGNMIVIEDQNNLSVAALIDYEIEGYKFPAFFFANSNEVKLFKNNPYIDFSINVEDSEKLWKTAAIEPILGPGILFNTIKSGIAVDWPCATGSIASITPYNTEVVTNTYYPKSYKMYEHRGEQNLQNAYGILRSNIDYRFPFEAVIFPEKGFTEKEEITTNISRKKILQSLDEGDEFVENIKNTYIYGGYEPYISNMDFSDINQLGPKRFSVPFVYRKKDTTDNGLYSMAMSNFLAETVQFFLEGKNPNSKGESKGEMIAFVSKEDSQWPKLDTSKTYYMDIVMKKSSELVMMEAYHSDLHPRGTNGEKMNGRYFGYPVNKTNKDIWGEEEFTETERRTIHNDPAYAPYTPPYFEGTAKLRLSYKPTSEDFKFDDLEKGIVIEEIYDGLKDAHESSDAYINKMSIESSINLFGKQFGTRINSDGLEEQDTTIKYWVISPKMETPVLDFSNQTLESYQNDYSKTSGFGRGMWSGYGGSPKDGKGIEIKLENPYPQLTTSRNSLTGSLVDLLFKEQDRSKKIGKIASKRKISEGLVVIPYLEKETPQTVKLDNGTDQSENSKFNFIKVDKDIYEEVENAMKSGAVKSKDNSIAKMIEGMRKYILPPPLDFVRNDNVPKIAMYIIDIEHTLERKDLEDIWQGVMPEISYTAKELGEGKGINLTHKSDTFELFHGKQMDPELRWMVFKVKQRGEKDYFKVTKDSSDDENFRKREPKVGRQLKDYSYNWPYDYFSLLEFAKIEIRLKHKKKE